MSVSIDRYSRWNHTSSIASERPAAWKHAVGSPYSAAKNDSKYAASAIDPHTFRIHAASACSWLVRTTSPCWIFPARRRASTDRPADTPAPIGAVHEVDEPLIRLRSEPGGHEMMRRCSQPTSAGGDLDEMAVEATFMDVVHRAGLRPGGGRQRPTRCRRSGLSSIGFVAVRSGDQRSGRQTLVGVAHDADVAVAVGEEEHHLVLGLVRVLVLVDEDVLEALAVVLEDVGVLAEELDGVREQVVEVHRPGLQEAGLVLGVDVGVFAVEDVLGPSLRFLGIDEFVLPEADDGVHATGRESLRVETEVADDVAGEPVRVGRVVDRELARVAEQVAVGAQDAHARRVERRHPHGLHDRADERADPLAHLGGCLVGEGDREDLGGMHTLVDQVGDAVREHPGLARTGAGDHEQRAGLVHDGIELIGVQPLCERRRPTIRCTERPLVGRPSAGCGMSANSSSSVMSIPL